MSSIHPPPPDRDASGSESAQRTEPARRPRYLVVALVAALVLGASSCTEGYGRLDSYHGGSEVQHARVMTSINDEGGRAEAEARYARFVDVANAASGRTVPMAAAMFVLGFALLTLASRGLSGKANTRSAIMQVLAAQSVVLVASYFITRDLANAEADWLVEATFIQQRERMPEEQFQRFVPMVHAMRRWVPPGWLVVRTVASALVVVALSRPRARAFFEAAARPVSDR